MVDVTPYVNVGAAVLALYLLARIGDHLKRIADHLEARRSDVAAQEDDRTTSEL